MSHRYDKNKDPSQKYYNILVKNNNTGYDKDGVATTKTGAVELAFEQTRTIPYIHYPRDFFMSVVAFEMDTQSVPVFIADPVVGQSNVDKLVYTITMEYSPPTGNHLVAQSNVVWFPEDASATVPTGNVPDAYNMDPYYYAYTYQHLISVVNATLQSTWTSLGITGVTNPLSIFMTLENNMVTLYGNNTLCRTNSVGTVVGATGAAVAQYVKVYFNSELFNLFSSLEGIKQPQPLPFLTPTASYLNTNYQLLFTRETSCKNNVQIPSSFSYIPPASLNTMIANYSEYSPLP